MMRTLERNTIVVERMTTTYQEILCDLPVGVEVEFDGKDAFILEPNRHDPAERRVRADKALKNGLIFVSDGKSERTVVARLRHMTTRYDICDVPQHYVIGCDDSGLYLMKRNKQDPQPQKWPSPTLDNWQHSPKGKGVLSVYDALVKKIIRVR